MLQAIQQIVHLLHVFANSLHIIQHFRLRILDLCQIAITADEPVEFTTGIRSSGPITITGSVQVPTLTFPRSFCSVCNLTRSCSSGVSSSRLQRCIFVSASSEVVLLEPWLRMWILFLLEPYGIRYRSKNHVQLYFMYVATGGGGLSKISLHLKHETKF